MKVKDELIAEGKAEPHHILPRSGWITFRFRKNGDVEKAVNLFRLCYELAGGNIAQQVKNPSA